MRLMVVLVLVLLGAGGVWANPFGTGVPAEPVPGFGFDALIVATAQAQSEFYQGLTAALRAVSSSTSALWALLGLSFAYGVAHAAGPGHGKMVIGSYMLASGDTARRGALLAFGSAMVQASVAVALVGLLAGLFGLSQSVLSSTTITLERFGYGLIVVLGLYLFFTSVRQFFKAMVPHQHAHSHAGHGHVHTDHTHADHHHVHDEHCGCGHAHVPDADAVADSQNLAQTLALIVGAGLRPCTGALLVLVLALSQGLFWAGSLAAYAMGAGTALTVGVLAVFASGLSRFFRSADGGGLGGLLAYAPFVLGLVGSVAIIGFGALLLAASLAR
jgi:nickel/cobalt transporter (NicO) family protein